MGAILTRDVEGVIEVWNMHKQPVFALFEGEKKLLFSCVEENEEDRLYELKKYLNVIKTSGSYATFTIYFYEDPGKKTRITTATPYFGSLPFKLNNADGMEVVQPGGRQGVPGNFNMELMNQVFASKLEIMDMKYQHQMEELKRIHEKELEDATAEEEEERVDANDIIGRIGQAGEKYPWMQEHIKDGITIVKHLVKKFTNGVLGDDLGMGASGTIAGAPQGANPTEKLNWSVKTMLTYYHGKYGNQENGDKEFADDMERLANMCTTDADLFDLMIKKLRAAA